MMNICNPSMTADSIDVKQLCISVSVTESLKMSHCTDPSHIPTAVATYALWFVAALGDQALPAQLSMLGRGVSTLALLAGDMSSCIDKSMKLFVFVDLSLCVVGLLSLCRDAAEDEFLQPKYDG